MQKENYDDIINLQRPRSEKHIPMPREARAAQFAPFAALTGYDDAVKETARLVGTKYELDDERNKMLNERFSALKLCLREKVHVCVTCFVPDARKNGGKYVTKSGRLFDIDDIQRVIVLDGKTKISMDDIYVIDSEIFPDRMPNLD